VGYRPQLPRDQRKKERGEEEKEERGGKKMDKNKNYFPCAT